MDGAGIKNMRDFRGKAFCVKVLAATLLLGVGTLWAVQTSPLTISAPAPNTEVSPGETISIVVNRSPNSGITAVGVTAFGHSPILRGKDPLTFKLTIPADAQPGPFSVIAVDLSHPGLPDTTIQSVPLTLVVKSPQLTELRTTIGELHLRFAGSKARVNLVGILPNAGVIHLEDSSQVRFNSSDQNVASVDQSGHITATGAGNTTIVATYTNPDKSTVSATVQVVVPKSIPGDLNGDGVVDREDLGVIQAALNTPANGPNDARDLNHDGKIDALDVQILTTLCTHPGCAYK